MGEPTTTIEVKIKTWEKLYNLKKRGDSFDDVIGRLLGIK